MKNRIIQLTLLSLILLTLRAYSQDDKFASARTKESDVPNYVLPDLLTSFNGKKITSIKQWETKRRPEIIRFFAENMYGKVPTPPEPVKKSFKLIAEDKNFMEGLCTKKIILVTFSNSKKSLDMQLVTFVPNNAKKPVPAIYHLNHGGVKGGGYDLTNSQRYGQVNSGVPLRQLILRGIGLVASDIGELINGDGKAEVLQGGILDLYFQPGQTNTRDDEWGMMAIWAFGLSSGMDYLETQNEINPRQVALMGCSVLGKVALWAAAQDQRFGMVLSNTTGHAGDAIWRREFGETYDNMCEWLPRWIGKNAQKYKGRVAELPVDQHMLLACIAPRPLFISSGEYDYWADSKGAWISAYNAIPVYKMYRQNVDFKSEKQPQVNEVIMKSAIGYNLRTGFHGTDQRDWENYMQFIEYHFMKIEPHDAQAIYYPEGKLINHYPNKTGKSQIVR